MVTDAARRLYAGVGAATVSVSDSRKGRPWGKREERIERLIARMFAGDPRHRLYAKRVRERQLRLQRALGGSAWRLYLLLEEAEVRRWTYVVDRLAERLIVIRALSRKRRRGAG